MFLLTFEFLHLRFTGIFLSITMASPLTSEVDSERVKYNEPSRCNYLTHTVSQSKVAVLTAGRNWKGRKVDRKTSVALISTRPTYKQLRVYPVQYWQGQIQSWPLGRASDSFYCLFHVGNFLGQLFAIGNASVWESMALWPPGSG